MDVWRYIICVYFAWGFLILYVSGGILCVSAYKHAHAHLVYHIRPYKRPTNVIVGDTYTLSVKKKVGIIFSPVQKQLKFSNWEKKKKTLHTDVITAWKIIWKCVQLSR